MRLSTTPKVLRWPFSSFFFLLFLALFLEKLAKVYLQIFHHMLSRKCMTRIVLTNILLVICLLLLETRVTHHVPRTFEKLAIVELSQHADVINVFHSVNLTLFTVTRIHSIRKRTRKTKTWKQDGK